MNHNRYKDVNENNDDNVDNDDDGRGEQDSLTLNNTNENNPDYGRNTIARTSVGGGDSSLLADGTNDTTTAVSTEAFQASSRLWREEYEARLDAIQKRFG